MKQAITFILTMALAICAIAQPKAYQCTYEMTMSIGSQLDQMEDGPVKEMIVSQMAQMKTYFTLTYADGKSVFEIDADATNSPIAAQAGHLVYTDYGAMEQITLEEFFGRAFRIEEPLTPMAWKLGSEQRKIGDRLCTKATLDEGDHTITVWFWPATPIPAGPMGFWGLPGLIAQLEVEGATYTLTQIKALDTAPVMKAPSKGKKMTREEYTKLIQEKMSQMGINMNGGKGIQVIQMQ